MNNENLLYWIWLSTHCGVASREFGRLITRHQDPFEIYRMGEEELEHLEGISSRLKLRLGNKNLETSYEILRYCQQRGVRIVTYGDPVYPERLKNIEDPPVLLYVLGQLPELDRRLCIGVVGTREMSEYGKHTAYTISYELAAARAVVVSGLAKGVDGVAACGALAAQGDTVAVLGCGISIAYPKEHKSLLREVVKRGAVITEYPPSERPNGWNFPKRNRIISALSQGVFMVEGSAKSGALITAECAITQGRALFALPGEVGKETSVGPNELIRRGARMARCAEDILKTYEFLYGDVLDQERRERALRTPVSMETVFARCGVAELYGSPKEEQHRTRLARRSSYDPKETKEDGKREITKENEPRSTPTMDQLPSLDETTRRVYLALPEDRLFSVDSVVCDELSAVEVLTSLTMLELCGLVISQPGGLYRKR